MTKPVRTFFSLAFAAGLGLALSACGGGSTSSTTTTNTAASPAAMASASSMGSMSGATNRYGGPDYTGAPSLPVTVALVMAGGGPGHFSIAKALTSMVGADLTGKEVAKLDKQYGKASTDSFIKTFDFGVNDAVKIAIADGIKLPAPAPLKGHALASALVKAGTASDGTFWEGLQLDHAVSHKIHVQVMSDMDKAPGIGPTGDANYHKIANQAHYDLAQALGMTSVKLASDH